MSGTQGNIEVEAEDMGAEQRKRGRERRSDPVSLGRSTVRENEAIIAAR